MFGYMYAVVVACLWGLAALVEATIIHKLSPLFLYVVGGLCVGISALIVLFFKWRTLLPMLYSASPRILGVAILASIAAMVVGNLLFLFALDKANSPSIVTVLAYCAPIFTLIGSIVLLQYKVTPLELVGIAMTIIGVFIIGISIKE